MTGSDIGEPLSGHESTVIGSVGGHGGTRGVLAKQHTAHLDIHVERRRRRKSLVGAVDGVRHGGRHHRSCGGEAKWYFLETAA